MALLLVACALASSSAPELPGNQCAAVSCAAFLRLQGQSCTVQDITTNFPSHGAPGNVSEIVTTLRMRQIDVAAYQMEWPDVLNCSGSQIIRLVDKRKSKGHFVVLTQVPGGTRYVLDPMMNTSVKVTKEVSDRLSEVCAGEVICCPKDLPLEVRFPWLLRAATAGAVGLVSIAAVSLASSQRKQL